MKTKLVYVSSLALSTVTMNFVIFDDLLIKKSFNVNCDFNQCGFERKMDDLAIKHIKISCRKEETIPQE